MQIEVSCSRCERFDGQDTCTAFPEGVPVDILVGLHDHRTSHPGDKGLLFQPIHLENDS